MPTLPGRAASITDVLTGHHPHASTPVAAFDWPALVREHRPGDQSPTQQRQAQRLAHVRQDTGRWAAALGLPDEHLTESAFYATVATSADARHEQAVALAKTVYWIYLLDDLLDRQDFTRLAAQPPERVAASLDARIAALLRPVAREAGDEASAPSAAGQRGAAMPADDDAEQCAVLAAALASLFAALESEWALLPGGWRRHRVRRRLVARELARCAAGMRQEVHWNVAFAREAAHPALPSLREYLRGGEVSIGMPAVAAVLASFERRPAVAWRRGTPAILAGGRVVRLTNDLHTYFADAEEGKVTAITIGLAELGLPTRGLDPESSQEVRQAQAGLAEVLAAAIGDFSARHLALGDGPLGHGVRHAVAFALAVYGDGSRVRSAPSAA